MIESGNIGKKTILLIALVLLLAGILYFKPSAKEMLQYPTMQEKSTLIETSDIQVSITQDGFSPQTIQIKKGQSVTFTNTDSREHQVASDPHPTHTNLPGFDNQEALLMNDSYVYTFEKTGTFTYHDHLNPLKFHGTVVVTE